MRASFEKPNLAQNVGDSHVYDIAPWVSFVRAAETLMQRLPMDEIGLEQLQERAVKLEQSLVQVQGQSAAIEVYDLLIEIIGAEADHALSRYSRFFEITRVIDDNALQIQELIEVVRATALELTDGQFISLAELSGALDAAIDSQPQDERKLSFDFGSGPQVINLSTWEERAHKSRLRKMVSQFLHHERTGDHDSFFPEGKAETYNPVRMNPYGKPVAEFTGDAVLDGMYTHAAYKSEVKASVTQVAELLGKLGKLKFDLELTQDLRRFVQRKVYDYAEDYGQQMADFYSDFSIQARSTQAIQIVISQMLDPVSPFQDFLRAVENNASFTFADEQDELLLPMIALAKEYEPLIQILKETEDGGKLKRYRAVLAQLNQRLSGVELAERS